MFCSQTISVYVLMRQRISALNVQSVLSREKDIEVLVLQPDYPMNLQAIADFRPDVLITDTATFDEQPVAVLSRIKKSGATRFLFLCSSSGDEVAEILAHGADGVIATSAPSDLLAVAVRSLACGRAFIDKNTWFDHLKSTPVEKNSPDSEPAMSRLSYREIEVLRLAGQGLSNREIAKAMDLGYDIIKCCMWLIVRKLHARGRVHAVSVARECGIFS